MSETTKPTTIVDSRSGDTPTEIPGQVKPGQTLRERAGIKTKTPEKKPEEKVEPKPEKVDKKPAAKKPAAQAPVPSAVIDQDAVNAAASTAAVAAVKAIAPKPEAKVEPKETDGLSPSQVKKFNVLSRMETLNPASKGIASKFAASAKRVDEYRKSWEAKNPGKKFNVEEVEHEEFLTEHDVRYDQDEYIEALADMKSEERTKAAMAPIEERAKKDDDEKANAKRIAAVEPEAGEQARASSKLLFDELGGDFADVMDERNFVKKDVLTKLQTENEYTPLVLKAAGDTETVAAELKRLAKGVSAVDLQKPSPLHAHICEFIWSEDAKMKELPAEDQMRDGKMFATTAEWAAMNPAVDPKSAEGQALAKKRENYWTFSDEDLSKLYAAERAKKLREHIEADEKSFQERVAKRGLTPSNNGKHVFQPAPKAPIVPPIQRRETSPATPAMPRMAPSTKSDPNTSTPLRKRLF